MGGNGNYAVPIIQGKSGGRGNKIPKGFLKSDLQLQAMGGSCE